MNPFGLNWFLLMKFKLIERFSIIIKDFKSNTESRNSVNVSPCASLFCFLSRSSQPNGGEVYRTHLVYMTCCLLSFSVKKKKKSQE